MGEKNKIELETIEAVLGEDASDELKAKAKTLFEAAVEAKVTERLDEVNSKVDEMVAEKLAEELKAIQENVDKYVSYVAEQWLEDNAIAIETNLRVERADAILEGVAELMAAHNVVIPEGGEDIVEALDAKNDELAGKLSEALKELVDLKDALFQKDKAQAVQEASEGLTAVQVEKLKTLAESVKDKTLDGFVSKLKTLKESFFKETKTVPAKDALDTGELNEDVTKKVDPDQHLAAFKKFMNG